MSIFLSFFLFYPSLYLFFLNIYFCSFLQLRVHEEGLPSLTNAAVLFMGHHTYASLVPEVVPAPLGVLCKMCGTPCTACIPCLWAGVALNICDFGICGPCCSAPEVDHISQTHYVVLVYIFVFLEFCHFVIYQQLFRNKKGIYPLSRACVVCLSICQCLCFYLCVRELELQMHFGNGRWAVMVATLQAIKALALLCRQPRRECSVHKKVKALRLPVCKKGRRKTPQREALPPRLFYTIRRPLSLPLDLYG